MAPRNRARHGGRGYLVLPHRRICRLLPRLRSSGVRTDGGQHDRDAARATGGRTNLHAVWYRFGRCDQAAVWVAWLDDSGRHAVCVDYRLEFSAADLLCQVSRAVTDRPRRAAAWRRSWRYSSDDDVDRVHDRVHRAVARRERRERRLEYSGGSCSHRPLDAVPAGVTPLAGAGNGEADARQPGPRLELHDWSRNWNIDTTVLVALPGCDDSHGAERTYHRGARDARHGRSRSAAQPDRGCRHPGVARVRSFAMAANRRRPRLRDRRTDICGRR